MKTTIYVITHKEFQCPSIEGYIPLQVGNNKDLGYLRDNVGENISKKNKNYCELTGLYWIWKNDINSDIIGISHYRRFFKKHGVILKKEKIEKILDSYDIIVPKEEIYKETVQEQYCLNSGFLNDLETTRSIIEKLWPDYINSYDKIMKQNILFQYNMMICSKKLYNKYCEWLFSILNDLEGEVNLYGYNSYQQRLFGFLSERLLNVWIDKNDLKVNRVNVFNTEDTIIDTIRINLRRMKNKLIFKIKSK